MSYWKVILATMVIFGTGVVTGGLLVRGGGGSRGNHPPARQAPARPNPGQVPGAPRLDLLRKLEKELNLSPEQHERAIRLFGESQDRSKRIMEPVHPALMDELRHTREQFRDLLTPAQRDQFDAFFRQRQRDQRHPPAGRDHAPDTTNGDSSARPHAPANNPGGNP